MDFDVKNYRKCYIVQKQKLTFKIANKKSIYYKFVNSVYVVWTPCKTLWQHLTLCA